MTASLNQKAITFLLYMAQVISLKKRNRELLKCIGKYTYVENVFFYNIFYFILFTAAKQSQLKNKTINKAFLMES